MMATLGDNPIFLYMVFIGVAGAVIYLIFSKKQQTFKDFKPQRFDKTIYDELQKKTNTYGKSITAKLFIGLTPIARIDKFKIIEGKFENVVYDSLTRKAVIDENNPIHYKFLILRAKSQNVFFRLLGLRKSFYIIEIPKEKPNFIKFDARANRFILPENADMWSYGNVWVFSDNAVEYINDISIKRMNEQIMMYTENFPDKTIHLEQATARKERIERIISDIDKSKWEKRKSVEESVIT